MQGKVQVDGKVITKAGQLVPDDVVITMDLEEPKYVSRAGLKLEHALDHFGIDVQGKIALDAGLSTGGFTDCLLQRGIERVYGVDVGYGQVHEKIRNDPRVIVMERTNLRHLDKLPEMVDIVTLDLSFISVLKVMDAVCHVLKKKGILLVLIKPQFEAEKKQVGKGGIVKDETVYKAVIDKVTQGIESYGFTNKGVIPSPITGTMGNKEFLSYFLRK
jgi:23S rRNA (cytidine1920-2'-O)/16S rRNA (cytidine1409-2'-O)-methyltransferase